MIKYDANGHRIFGDWLIDRWENRWSIKKAGSLEEAARRLLSNWRCQNCRNCIDCANFADAMMAERAKRGVA